MHQHAAVGFDDQQAGGSQGGKMGGETTGVVDGAAGNHETHLARVLDSCALVASLQVLTRRRARARGRESAGGTVTSDKDGGAMLSRCHGPPYRGQTRVRDRPGDPLKEKSRATTACRPPGAGRADRPCAGQARRDHLAPPATEVTSSVELSEPGPAVVIDPGVLYIGGTEGEVTVTGASSVSMITASNSDIDAYLDGVQYTRITGASSWSTLSTETVNADGDTELTDPTSSDLWRTVETQDSPP